MRDTQEVSSKRSKYDNCAHAQIEPQPLPPSPLLLPTFLLPRLPLPQGSPRWLGVGSGAELCNSIVTQSIPPGSREFAPPLFSFFFLTNQWGERLSTTPTFHGPTNALDTPLQLTPQPVADRGGSCS
jgi:hypothetical protein